MKSVLTAEPDARGGACSLIRMVDWAHRLLAEVLAPGDLAIDLTAGQGRDTHFLFRQVGFAGRVLAFDIQEKALRTTASLLETAGASVHFHADPPPGFPPGVHLLHASHALLDRFLPDPPQAVIANLGYLPGGDPAIATAAETTLAALDQAFRRLKPGGRLAVTVYTGQAGGIEEGEVVSKLFASLPAADWHVLRLHVGNRPTSPYLLVAARL
jgi:predicted methyltransferase